MKMSYKLWLLFGDILPFNGSGKLVLEPYKGFMSDIHELKFIENEIKQHRKQPHDKAVLENKINTNTTRWKQGERW
jgi:hypothetical protein